MKSFIKDLQMEDWLPVCVSLCVWVVCVCECVTNIKSYISHTLTIHCPNHKALTFIKIIVQQINYLMKCLGQVTGTRTMAYSSIHHSVVLTAVKNKKWHLDHRVKSRLWCSCLRIRNIRSLLNNVVNEIWSSYCAGYEGHCDLLFPYGKSDRQQSRHEKCWLIVASF